MQKETLFRGKRVDNGKWIEGCLTWTLDRFQYFVREQVDGIDYEVVPETTGQFTGLIDKNGRRIFEGDIISGFLSKNYGRYGQQKFIPFNGEIKYSFGQFYIKTGTTKEGVDRCVCFSQLWPLSPNSVEIEIIGNIHDNPSLAIWKH